MKSTCTIFSKKSLFLAVLGVSISNASIANELSIEEIIVTAQKRAESLQDVPVSISALSSADLEGLKLRSSMDIASQIPNMQITSTYGDTVPAISLRGVTQGDFNLNQNGPNAIYVDEGYKGPLALSGIQLFDIERVEVLRGPQGTLYGKNATGGAVNIHTVAPSFETSGYIGVGIGNFNRTEVKGAYEQTLIDDVLAVRGAFIYNQADGFTENKAPGKHDVGEVDDFSGRLTFSYTPSDTLAATLRLHKGESSPLSNSPQSEAVIASAGIGFIPGNTRAALNLDPGEANVDLVEETILENEGIQLRLDLDLNDEHSLTSISSYDEGLFVVREDTDGSPYRVIDLEYRSEVRQITQEFRVTSNYEGQFNWIGGLYFAKEEMDNRNQTNFAMDDAYYALFGTDPVVLATNGIKTSLRNQYTQTRESYAGFIHTTYDFSDDLTLTFGLRYTEDKTEMTNLSSYSDSPIGETPLISPSVDDDFSDENVSGKIGLDYHVTSNTMLYASYSEGYRNGVYNGVAYLPTEITKAEPEELSAYEIGFKTQLLNGSLQINGAAFYYEYENQQFLDYSSTTFAQTVRNAGESELKGVELEVVARPTQALTVQAGIGFLHSEYTKLTLDSVDLSGNDLVQAPELNFNAAINYEVFANDNGNLNLLVDTSFVDDYFYQPQNSRPTQVEDRWVSNARLSYQTPAQNFEIALWVKNIEDKHYKVSGVDVSASNFIYSTVGAPRTYGAEFTYSF